VLKPADDPSAAPDADNERPVGELVQELIEDGKAYAQAELEHAKAIATAKANAFKLPAILFGAALVLALAAVSALAWGVAAALATLIGPLAGGGVAFLLFAGLAGGLGWYGAKRLRGGL
jgi:hypothetical protein